MFKRVYSKAATALEKSAKTVNIQIPPATIPWTIYETEPRVQPTRSSIIPSTDKAYDSKEWTPERDEKLIKIMRDTPEGLLQDYEKIRDLLFGDEKNVRARDVRLRWNTFLKPATYTLDKGQMEIVKMKRQYGPGIEVVNGRWCFVPPALSSGGDYAKSGKNKNVFEYSSDTSRITSSGPSCLELSVQILREVENDRKYRLDGDLEKRTETRRLKREGVLLMDEVGWISEEDLALREAFEEFGDNWDRVCKALRVRRRSADECRERLEQLSAQDWKHFE